MEGKNPIWKDKTILITGACGLIGAPLCFRLLQEGAIVHPLDVNPPGIFGAYALDWNTLQGVNANLVTVSIKELANVVRGADVIFHLAAISGVEQSRQNPWLAYQTNVMATVNMLEAVRLTDPGKVIIVASSNHIYGSQYRALEKTREGAPLWQMDTYSVSKICADYIARSYAHNYKVHTVIIRNTNCFSPYDPHDDHLIPSTILSLLAGHRPVIRGTGETIKSYLYVEDVVDAYMKAAEWALGSGIWGSVFNVSDERISVLDMVKSIIRLMNSPLEPVLQNQRNDQQDESLDSTKIRRFTGWYPRHSLTEGLQLTIDGFEKRQRTVIPVVKT